MSNKGRLYIPNQNLPRICPELAVEIGLNESLLLLQLDYWIANAGKERDDRLWVFESLSDIQEAFKFWSRATINRTIHSLQDKKLIAVSNYNQRKADKTRWIAINYPNVAKLKSILVADLESAQNDTSVSECNGLSQNETDLFQNETTLPHVPHESSHEETPVGDSPESLSEEWPTDSNLTVHEPVVTESLTEPDPILDMLKAKERLRGKRSWTVPPTAGGADSWLDGPLAAACALLRIAPDSLPEQTRFAWARQLEKIAQGVEATPAEFAEACKLWPKYGPSWKGKTGPPYSNIFRGAFPDDIQNLILQLKSGTIESNEQWSRAL